MKRAPDAWHLTMNYAECLNYLGGLGYELRGTRFDLDAIQAMLAWLGDPQLHYPTALVAGTNGKGSTCAMLASILERAGYRTGLYTSPHLVRVNERIRIAGHEIPDGAFADSFTAAQQAVNELLASGRLERLPSFFEFLTATGFLHFARERVDFVVLEVGMGGRLDATNVTQPRVAVITNVDMDHEAFLGSTRAAIASEKAGVIKANRPVVSGCEHPDASDVIRQKCEELGAELLDLPRMARVSKARSRDGRFIFDLTLDCDCFPNLALSLPGKFQIKNAVAAVMAAWRLQREGLVIPKAAMREGLRATRWPGRLQVVHEQPRVLLDGAHNPAAARELAEFVREEFAGRPMRLVYASMQDKAIEEISEILFPLAEEVYLAQAATPRAASPEEILRRAGRQSKRIVIEPDPARALEAACRASSKEGVVLVAGSLFLVGAIQQAQSEGRLALHATPEHSVGPRLF